MLTEGDGHPGFERPQKANLRTAEAQDVGIVQIQEGQHEAHSARRRQEPQLQYREGESITIPGYPTGTAAGSLQKWDHQQRTGVAALDADSCSAGCYVLRRPG